MGRRVGLSENVRRGFGSLALERFTVAGEVWIIDTSSIVEVRRAIPVQHRRAVFQKLSDHLTGGLLTFPRQVLTEFERPRLKRDHDHGWEWVKRHADHCSSHEPLFEYLAEAYREPQVQRVLDPDKDHEEADPYVLALALKLRAQGATVGVITQDVVGRANKLALKDACGLLRIVSISALPYLEQQGILVSGGLPDVEVPPEIA